MNTPILLGYDCKELKNGYWSVTSPAGREYTVHLADHPTCDCADFVHRSERAGHVCKHIDFVRRTIEARELPTLTCDATHFRLDGECGGPVDRFAQNHALCRAHYRQHMEQEIAHDFGGR